MIEPSANANGVTALADAPGIGIIRVLSQEVTSRIAAGEVVERPASVVKELAENALDAGARHVHVEIAGGGRDLIRVSDDGTGMSPTDLALCVLPHATSKLTSADELTALNTLGFRGEALPSIASCSKFSVTSSQRSSPATSSSGAWRIDIEGGVPAHPVPRPASGAFGTVVEVRNLFYNLPARAKFLKGAAAEAAACTDVLMRLALSRPDAGFTLTAGAHEIFSLLPCVQISPATPRASASAAPVLPIHACHRRAREVLGRANSKGLLELSAEGPATEPVPGANGESARRFEGYRLYGLISPPALSRPNRSCIYLNVNGRPVKDRTLTSALLESCRHLLPPKRYPIAVLHLDLPGSDVDINVHPTKAEVRFRLPGLIYALFHHAIRRAFGVPDSISSAPVTECGSSQVQIPPLPPSVKTPLGAPKPSNGQVAFDLWPGTSGLADDYSPKGPEIYETRTDVVDTPHKKGVPVESLATSAHVAEDPVSFSRAEFTQALSPQTIPVAVPAGQEPAPAPGRHVAPFRVLGQAGGSYIVLEDDTGVKLIDQHALHERVLFEILLARAQGHTRGDAQGLLIPETLELTPVQAAIFNQDSEASALLHTLGFDVEAFGPRTIAVSAIPAVLKSPAAVTARLVKDVLDALAESTDDPAGARKTTQRAGWREKAAYVLSCKGAVKAGERLSLEQMSALVLEYRTRVAPSGFTCPHGRPVALELSWDELQRAVGR